MADPFEGLPRVETKEEDPFAGLPRTNAEPVAVDPFEGLPRQSVVVSDDPAFAGLPMIPDPEIEVPDPSWFDYLTGSWKHMGVLIDAPRRKLEGALLDPEDYIAAQDRAETVKRWARNDIASIIGAFPGDRPKRIANDLISESFVRPISSTIELAGTVAEDLGIENSFDDLGRALADIGINSIDESFGPDAFGPEDFGDVLTQGVASTLGFLIPGAKMKVSGRTMKEITGTTAILGAAIGAQIGREDAEAHEATPEQIKMAYYLNGVAGTSEAVPVFKAFNRIDKTLGGLLSKKITDSTVGKVTRAAISGAIEEGLQEGFQTLAANEIASAEALSGYDPGRPLTENLVQATASGGSVGLLMSLVTASLGVRIKNQRMEERIKEFEKELLPQTGATSIDQIFFDEEGIATISILSDEYIKIRDRIADLRTRQQEKADLLETELPETAAAMGALAEEAANKGKKKKDKKALFQDMQEDTVSVLDDEGMRLSTGGNFGVQTQASGQVTKSQVDREPGLFFSWIVANKELEGTDSVFDRVKKTPVTAALTKELGGMQVMVEFHQNQIKLLDDGIREIEEGRSEYEGKGAEEAVVNLQELRQKHVDDVKVYKAAESELKRFAKAIKDEVANLKQTIPGQDKWVLQDYMKDVKNLNGEVRYGTANGAVHIWDMQYQDGTKQRARGIYLDTAPIAYAARQLAKAKLRGDSKPVVEAYKRALERRKMRVYSTLLHEVGHHFAFSQISNLLAKVENNTATEFESTQLDAIIADYYLWSTKVLGSPFRKSMWHMFTLPRAAKMVEDQLDQEGAVFEDEVITVLGGSKSQRAAAPTFEGRMLSGNFMDYAFSFDEYLAEQFALYQLQKGNYPNKKLAPYFRDGVKGLKRMHSKVKGRFTATQSFTDFLENLSLMGKLKQASDKIAARQTLDVNPMFAAGKNKLLSPKVAAERAEDIDRFNWFMDVGFNILQIADQNPRNKPLQEYTEILRNWKNEVNGHLARAEDTLTRWKDLSRTQQELLGRILFDETLGRTYDGKVLKKPRAFTQDEVSQYGLTPEALELRAKIKEDFKTSLKEMEGVLKRKVTNMFLEDPARQVQELDKITKEFNQLRSTPYFPLMRFGDYVTIAYAKGPQVIDGQNFKDGQVVDFQAFDNARERDKAWHEQRRLLGGKVTVAASKMRTPTYSLQGMPLTLVEHLERTLGETLTPEQKAAFDIVKKDVLPFKSFKKQFIKRKKVHGYSIDAARAYANYMTSFANHIGRVKWDSDFQQAFKDLDQSIQIRNRAGMNTDKRVGILNHMQEHYNYVMNPVNEFVNLRSAAFFWFLGYNVKSAFVNGTQIPLVTYPYLAARFGDGKATAALTRAYGTATKALTKKGAVDQEVMAMIERGLKESWLDESLATELAVAASEPNLERFRPRKAVKSVVQKVSEYGAVPFHVVEKFNRHIAAVAAFRLAKAQGMTQEQAIFEARRAVEKTQFEYARWARPKFMRGKVGGTIFVFQNYMQNALYFALGGDPGAFRMWLMLFLFAGLQGLPFGEDIMDLVDGAMSFAKKKLGMKDPLTDVRTDLREAITDIGANPDLILHGLSSSTFGLANIGEFMGWPIPSLDLSGSLSMGRIVPGAGLARPGERTFERFLMESTERVGGAALSGGVGIGRAIFDNHPDQWKRWERAMPAAMRQISKAARYTTRGEEASRGGFPIAEFDQTDWRDRVEIIGQGLGFTPLDVSTGWDGYIAAQNMVRYYESYKQDVLKKWNYARENDDQELISAANKAIAKYNRIVPYPEMKIGYETRIDSFESYRENRKFNEAKIERSKAFRRASRDIQEVYRDADN